RSSGAPTSSLRWAIVLLGADTRRGDPAGTIAGLCAPATRAEVGFRAVRTAVRRLPILDVITVALSIPCARRLAVAPQRCPARLRWRRRCSGSCLLRLLLAPRERGRACHRGRLW